MGAIARERDCGRLEWVAHNSNAPAVDFYKSLGAETLDGSSTFRMTGDALRRLATSSTR